MTNEPEPNTRAGEALEKLKELLQQPVRLDLSHALQLADLVEQNAPTILALLAGNTRPLPQPSELVDLIERLESHMGKQDPQILLADCREAALELRAQSVQLAKLQADGDKLAVALVTAMIPIEAILMSGADAAHCQNVRDALHDAKATAPQALTEWKDRA